MNFQRIDYLDLEIKSLRKTKVSLSDSFKLSCNIEHLENQYKHIPHTSNSQQKFYCRFINKFRTKTRN